LDKYGEMCELNSFDLG